MSESTQNQPFKPGTNWMPDRGKLYQFSSSSVMVIRPWPLPQAWHKGEVGGWRPACPRIDLRSADVARGGFADPTWVSRAKTRLGKGARAHSTSHFAESLFGVPVAVPCPCKVAARAHSNWPKTPP